MIVIPINGHVLIEPAQEKTVFETSQQAYEERGKVLGIAEDLRPFPITTEFEVGDYVYFDSWVAAKYKDDEGNEHWVVPYPHIRAVEKHG